MTDGFVYLVWLQPPVGTTYKIGWSKSPEARLKEFRTVAPNARLIRSWPGTRYHEKAILEYLDSHRPHVRRIGGLTNRRNSEVFSVVTLKMVRSDSIETLVNIWFQRHGSDPKDWEE